MFQTYFSLQSSKSWNQFLLVLQIQIAKNSCYILILFTMQPTSPSYESDASDTQLNYFTHHQFLFKLILIILTFIVIQNHANSGNAEHHVRGSLLLLGCLLIKSMLFLSFWIESVSSVHINDVSHYFYELMFIFFIGICCHKVRLTLICI